MVKDWKKFNESSETFTIEMDSCEYHPGYYSRFKIELKKI